MRVPSLEDSQDPQDKTKRRRASLTKKPLKFKRVTSLSLSIFHFLFKVPSTPIYNGEGQSLYKGKGVGKVTLLAPSSA